MCNTTTNIHTTVRVEGEERKGGGREPRFRGPAAHLFHADFSPEPFWQEKVFFVWMAGNVKALSLSRSQGGREGGGSALPPL